MGCVSMTRARGEEYMPSGYLSSARLPFSGWRRPGKRRRIRRFTFPYAGQAASLRRGVGFLGFPRPWPCERRGALRRGRGPLRGSGARDSVAHPFGWRTPDGIPNDRRGRERTRGGARGEGSVATKRTLFRREEIDDVSVLPRVCQGLPKVCLGFTQGSGWLRVPEATRPLPHLG